MPCLRACWRVSCTWQVPPQQHMGTLPYRQRARWRWQKCRGQDHASYRLQFELRRVHCDFTSYCKRAGELVTHPRGIRRLRRKGRAWRRRGSAGRGARERAGGRERAMAAAPLAPLVPRSAPRPSGAAALRRCSRRSSSHASTRKCAAAACPPPRRSGGTNSPNGSSSFSAASCVAVVAPFRNPRQSRGHTAQLQRPACAMRGRCACRRLLGVGHQPATRTRSAGKVGRCAARPVVTTSLRVALRVPQQQPLERLLNDHEAVA